MIAELIQFSLTQFLNLCKILLDSSERHKRERTRNRKQTPDDCAKRSNGYYKR